MIFYVVDFDFLPVPQGMRIGYIVTNCLGSNHAIGELVELLIEDAQADINFSSDTSAWISLAECT